MKRVILFLLALPSLAVAAPHHKGTLSSLNLGIRYSSILENRGVVFYPRFQIDPVLGVFLFDDKLEFLGDSIGYRDFVYSDVVRLRGRLVAISDDPLFPKNTRLRESLPNRKSTYELNARAEVFLPGYNDSYRSEIDVGYSKDLVVHHGNYFDLQSKFKIGEWTLPIVETRLEPNLLLSAGAGDSAHNRYFYGPDDTSSGITNISYGLVFAFPNDADRYYPIIQFTHFEVVGDAHRSAQYARGRNSGWLLSFIATYGALE
ncbi:MAG: hypothetical protein ABIR96_05350 [Bdellovibrionota bacterium]